MPITQLFPSGSAGSSRTGTDEGKAGPALSMFTRTLCDVAMLNELVRANRLALTDEVAISLLTAQASILLAKAKAKFVEASLLERPPGGAEIVPLQDLCLER